MTQENTAKCFVSFDRNSLIEAVVIHINMFVALEILQALETRQDGESVLRGSQTMEGLSIISEAG